MGVSSLGVLLLLLEGLSDSRALVGGLALEAVVLEGSWPSSFNSLNGFKSVSKSPIST